MKRLQHICILALLLLTAWPLSAIAEIPVVTRDGKEYYAYEVKKGDSVYGISRAHQWDETLLLSSNPQIASGLKRGETIYYPVKDVSDGQYRVKRGDTVYALASRFEVSVDAIYEANPNSRHGIFEGEILTIPAPKSGVEAEEEPTVAEEEEAVAETEKDDVLNIALLLDAPNGNRDLEFTRGFILALDNMKRSGRKIALNVLCAPDTIPYGDPAMQGADVIVTTSDKDLSSQLADYAGSRSARLVNVFDVKSGLYADNPSVVNMMTPTEYFNSGVARWLSDRYSDCQLFLLGNPDDGDTMAQEILSTFPTPPVLMSYEEMEDMTFADGDKVLVYCYASKKGDVTRSLELMASKIQETPLAYIAVVGRPNWVVYAEDLAGKLADAYALIPSRFYFNETEGETRRFVRDFGRLYGHEPVRSFPTYAASGYDTAHFIAEGGLEGESVHGLLSDIHSPALSGSGAANVASLMVKFSPTGVEKYVVDK